MTFILMLSQWSNPERTTWKEQYNDLDRGIIGEMCDNYLTFLQVVHFAKCFSY